GLPAMNDDAIFLTYRVDCIAGKPPPTVSVCSYLALCQGPLNTRAFALNPAPAFSTDNAST
ncbi:hypothetical protein V2J00_26130, partial [Pseudomonas viridiflava]|nr:hypothetical protein [Pseudomonas viridiflava]MEE3970922.1 hypothetical protein [Pseudomonas viridiflava]MEE3981426.1 hypothetical protein [Pseudomonas viridiflava]